jgi:excisionase family DNA binding protein
MEDILYTVKETAMLLKCNENTVNSLINSNMLKCIIIGRRKIPKSELFRFIEANLGQDVTDPFNPKQVDLQTKYKY